MKSEFALKRAWSSSACCCFSSGRSRTSWMDSAATMTVTWSRMFRRWAATIMRAKRGSVGMRDMSRPTSVNVCRSPPAMAPSSLSSATPSRTARESGACRKGNFWISPRPSASIARMTLARWVRRISGSVNSGRASKFSSEYIRIAIPSATRPQRPERCFAEAWLISSTGRRCTFVRLE